MPDLDETLQNQFIALEQGVPLEQVLENLPEGAAELEPLIRIAVAAQNLPYPQLRPEAVRMQKARIIAAVEARNQQPKFFRWLTDHARLVTPVRVAASLAILFLVVSALGFYTAGPVSAQSAKLENVGGLVEVASSASSDDWRPASNSIALHSGARIRTSANAQASLVFFDGSQTEIGPGSDVVVSDLAGGWGNQLKVKLTQNAGTTAHTIVPLQGSNSFFTVDTPSGQASVHGTSFDVAVAPDGQSRFSVQYGNVEVTNAGAEVNLNPGQTTVVYPGQDPVQPAYQFRLSGVLTAATDGQWTVNGVPVQLTAQTSSTGSFESGDLVSVQGRVLSGNQWVADQVEPAKNSSEKAQFTGVVSDMPGVPGTWTIDGKPVLVIGDTELSQSLQAGSTVKVSFVALPDGSGWLAKEIESLDDEEQKPEAKPSKKPHKTDTPEEATETDTVTPSDIPEPGEDAIDVTPTPKNETSRCENQTEDRPDAVKLAATYGVNPSEITAWFCLGYGFGEIDQAYKLAIETGKTPEEIMALRETGLGWGEIKREVIDATSPAPTKKPKPENSNAGGNLDNPGNSGNNGNSENNNAGGNKK